MLKKSEIVCLSLGTNLGNRLFNLQNAISDLAEFFTIKTTSHIIETKALLPENAQAKWNIPFFNMVIAGTTHCNPSELLSKIKEIEKKLGRDPSNKKWSPRIIDIDIVSYYEQEIITDFLTVPHKEFKNRDFLQYLFTEIGYEIPEDIKIDINNYSALNHFVLNPKFVGIVNVTPDSFSDGGCFFEAEKAEQHIRKLYSDGAAIIDIGAQSTKPNYTEIPPSEEINRLSEVLERCTDIDCISIDTYFDEVIEHFIKKHKNIKWINDQNSKLNANIIKLIADKNLKLVIMLHGTNFSWFKKRIQELEKLGMKHENIIVDPGIGFGKTKRQNIEIIKNIKILKDINCEILLGHSRKSFISFFSNKSAKDRDIETVAISSFAAAEIDYLRVHNVKDHMRFFVAKHCIENS